MAGSRTFMSGLIYTPATALSVPNASTNNTQPVIFNGLTLPSVNGNVNSLLNSNGIMSTHLFKPGGKILVQNTPNGPSLVVGPFSNNCISAPSKTEVVPQPGNPPNDLHILNHISPKEKNLPMSSPLAIDTYIPTEPMKEIADEPEIIEDTEEPVIDIMINNVVCSFSVSCHLDLRSIALTAKNVEFRRENGMVTMKLRRPVTTASIWSSGKITCTGSTSSEEARIAARRVARTLQKLGYNVRFRNYRVVNVLGTCTMPFSIKISQFSQKFRREASYEPELHPGVTYRIPDPKATLKIFSTGSITVTAPSVENVQSAIEHIYSRVKEFGKERTPTEIAEMRKNRSKAAPPQSENESDEAGDSDDN